MHILKPRIAIIGAGAAGVAAGCRLTAAGVPNVLFEKSRGYGGRCASRRWNWGIVDHGAQYFTLRDSEFSERVRRVCNDDVLPLEKPILDETGSPLPMRERFYHRDGNSRLIRSLAEGLDVRLETLVAPPETKNGIWFVGGEEFDAVLSTAPLPQTQTLAGRPPTQAFVPCLTWMGAYEGLWVGKTREVYAWSDHSTTPLAWTACENHKSGRVTGEVTVIVVQASAAFSLECLEAEPPQWASLLRNLAELRWEINAPLLGESTHRWRYARIKTAQSLPDLPATWACAGDAFSESRVESAWRSGWQAAGAWL